MLGYDTLGTKTLFMSGHPQWPTYAYLLRARRKAYLEAKEESKLAVKKAKNS